MYTLVHGKARNLLTGEQDAAGVRGQQSRDLVDERRLAGPVRADDSVKLALADIEVHVVGDDEGAVGLAQLLQAQKRLSHGCL